MIPKNRCAIHEKKRRICIYLYAYNSKWSPDCFVGNIRHSQSVNVLDVLDVNTELALDDCGDEGCSREYITL